MKLQRYFPRIFVEMRAICGVDLHGYVVIRGKLYVWFEHRKWKYLI